MEFNQQIHPRLRHLHKDSTRLKCNKCGGLWHAKKNYIKTVDTQARQVKNAQAYYVGIKKKNLEFETIEL